MSWRRAPLPPRPRPRRVPARARRRERARVFVIGLEQLDEQPSVEGGHEHGTARPRRAKRRTQPGAITLSAMT